MADSDVKMLNFKRCQQQREDGLSTTLQVAKAAEHLVCADLLLKGWNAYLTDAGLPYDVVVDLGCGRVCRIQVKATTRVYNRPYKPGSQKSMQPYYRFALRKSRTGKRRLCLNGCDYLALVALDRRLIAWMPLSSIINSDGFAKYIIELKTRQIAYSRGDRGVHPNVVGRFMEDFAVFQPQGLNDVMVPESNLGSDSGKAKLSLYEKMGI